MVLQWAVLPMSWYIVLKTTTSSMPQSHAGYKKRRRGRLGRCNFKFPWSSQSV